MHKPLVDRLLDSYVRLFLKVEPDSELQLSLLANIRIGTNQRM